MITIRTDRILFWIATIVLIVCLLWGGSMMHINQDEPRFDRAGYLI